MTGNQIVETELRNLLAAADGSYVAAYDQLVGEEDRRAVAKAPRTTLEHRRQMWQAAVAKLDRKMLAQMNKTLRNYMGLVRRNAEVTAAEAPRVLTAAEAHDLMVEHLDMKDIEVFVKARRDDIRRTVFGHLTESFAAAGEEHPEHVNGSLDVPELGKRFAREGTGRKDPELDEETLRRLLGEDTWALVTDTEIIPAQEVTTLSIDKVMRLAKTDPSILEKIRESLIVGEWKTPRFVVRDL